MSSDIRIVRTLDVRPMMARGEQPFTKIMGVVQSIRPGEGFVLITPFVPAPLIERLQSEGFSTRPELRGDGGWQTQFVLPKA
jgi:hypothetical protein